MLFSVESKKVPNSPYLQRHSRTQNRSGREHAPEELVWGGGEQ